MGDIESQRERWNERYRTGSHQLTEPNPFLLRAYEEHIAPLFPHAGTALDIAGGAGRHAVWLAQRRWRVTLADFSETGLAVARQNAGQLAERIEFETCDLSAFRAGSRSWDLVLVFFYLDRHLFAELERALKPGGVLLYKTYVREEPPCQEAPSSPQHLLEPGELRKVFPALEILSYAETSAPRHVAELIARKMNP